VTRAAILLAALGAAMTTLAATTLRTDRKPRFAEIRCGLHARTPDGNLDGLVVWRRLRTLEVRHQCRGLLRRLKSQVILSQKLPQNGCLIC
jgi:hypothetical protein